MLGRWVFSFSFGLTPSHRHLWLGKYLNCCKSWGRCVKCTPYPWLHFYDSQNIPWPALRLLDKRRRWVLGKVFLQRGTLSLPFPDDTALLHCGTGAPLGTISFHLIGRCTVSATLNDSSEPRSGTQPALPLLGEPYFHLCLDFDAVPLTHLERLSMSCLLVSPSVLNLSCLLLSSSWMDSFSFFLGERDLRKTMLEVVTVF